MLRRITEYDYSTNASALNHLKSRATRTTMNYLNHSKSQALAHTALEDLGRLSVDHVKAVAGRQLGSIVHCRVRGS